MPADPTFVNEPARLSKSVPVLVTLLVDVSSICTMMDEWAPWHGQENSQEKIENVADTLGHLFYGWRLVTSKALLVNPEGMQSVISIAREESPQTRRFIVPNG